jgi:hypothetical protein
MTGVVGRTRGSREPFQRIEKRLMHQPETKSRFAVVRDLMILKVRGGTLKKVPNFERK